MKHSWMKLLAIALLATFAFGCVSQKQYDDLLLLYRRSNEQVVDLKAKLEEAEARIKALQEAAGTNRTDPELMNKLAQAIADRDRLAKALADAQAQLGKAGEIGPVVLPPDLDAALKELAASDPDLMTYDPVHGMVKFRSDLTFALGSATVNPKAVATLGKFAEIINRPSAQKYEARIVGHTDNVRISKPETRAQFPTNWHLSAGRSIAVKDVLEKAGVQPVRLGIAGYGEYRPVVNNPARGGAEPNRRVEIYLVPNTYSGLSVNAEGGAADEAKASAPKAPAKAKAGAGEPPEAFK